MGRGAVTDGGVSQARLRTWRGESTGTKPACMYLLQVGWTVPQAGVRHSAGGLLEGSVKGCVLQAAWLSPLMGHRLLAGLLELTPLPPDSNFRLWPLGTDVKLARLR